MSVDRYATGLRNIKARDELGDCRLPGSRGSDQRRRLAWGNTKADLAQRQPVAVGKRDVLKGDLAANILEKLDPRARSFFGRHVEILEDALEDCRRANDLHLHAGQRGSGAVQPAQIRDERDDRADGQRSLDCKPRAASQTMAGPMTTIAPISMMNQRPIIAKSI